MKWNSLKTHLSLRSLLHLDFFPVTTGSPLGLQQQFWSLTWTAYKQLHFPICSAAKNCGARKNGRDGQSTPLCLCRHNGQSQAEAPSAPHISGRTPWRKPHCASQHTLKGLYPAWALTRDASNSWTQTGKLLLFLELSDQTQLASIALPLLTVLKICLSSLGCHPSQQWSLTHSPSKEIHSTHHRNTVVSLTCQWVNLYATGTLITWPGCHK